MLPPVSSLVLGKSPYALAPVVHSPEWTTGSSDFARNLENTPISHELVSHSPEWATGSIDLAGKQEKSPISQELVAHFPEWTTSSFDFAGKRGEGSSVLATNQGFPLKQKESA